MIFDLLWLDGHSLMSLPYVRAAPAPGSSSSSDGENWQTPEHVVGHGRELLKASCGAGARGDRRQAAGLRLPARGARRAAGSRSRPSAARSSSSAAGCRARAGAAAASARCCSASTRPTARLRYVGGSAPASPRASSTPGGPAGPPEARHLALHGGPASAARGAVLLSPGWWSRSSSASGHERATCASPPTRGCATTRTPGRSCGRTSREPHPASAADTRNGRARDPPRRRWPSSGRRSGGIAEVEGRDAQALQPGQGPLPRDRLHQGRPDRVLRRHLARPPRPPSGTAADRHPLARRGRGQVLLPEAVSRPPARVGAHGHRPERQQADRLHAGRGPADARVARQPGGDRAAHAARPGAGYGPPDRRWSSTSTRGARRT